MPVITPAYPSMCATFNITRSSMAIIKRELKRALDITENIMVAKAPWSDLFVKHTFFTAGYKYYISVITASKSKEHHKVWSGYVESKVRMLVQKLEQHRSIALARPFNKGYERRHRCKNESEIEQVQEGSLEFLVTDPSDTSEAKAEVKVDIKTEIKSEIQALEATSESVANATPQIKQEPGTDGHIKPEPTDEVRIKAEPMETGPITAAPVRTAAPAPVATPVPNGAVKSEPKEDVKPSKKSSLTEIFTTTHYIGLELDIGKFQEYAQAYRCQSRMPRGVDV